MLWGCLLYESLVAIESLTSCRAESIYLVATQAVFLLGELRKGLRHLGLKGALILVPKRYLREGVRYVPSMTMLVRGG